MIILFVSDQASSTAFYEKVLGRKPVLEVPGMTEFILSGEFKLGLMPEKSIAKIITPQAEHPKKGNGIPRCELYLPVGDPDQAGREAVLAGGRILSPAADRDWGDRVAYCQDPDGHIIAFAR